MNKEIEKLAAMSNFGHILNNDVCYDLRLETFAILIIKDIISTYDSHALHSFDKIAFRVARNTVIEKFNLIV